MPLENDALENGVPRIIEDVSSLDTGQILRNKLFYLDSVVFLVENELFRVPRRNLVQDSEVFSHMFDVPPHSNSEGTTDKNPIHLDQVRKDDFTQLLKAIYPAIGTLKEASFTTEEWISVLKMADRFICERVRLRAISRLVPLLEFNPALKYSLAMDYHIDEWKLPALNMLAQRAKPMGMEDVEILGEEVVLKLAAIRECAVKDNGYYVLGKGRGEMNIDGSGLLWDMGLLMQKPATIVQVNQGDECLDDGSFSGGTNATAKEKKKEALDGTKVTAKKKKKEALDGTKVTAKKKKKEALDGNKATGKKKKKKASDEGAFSGETKATAKKKKKK